MAFIKNKIFKTLISINIGTNFELECIYQNISQWKWAVITPSALPFDQIHFKNLGVSEL